VEEHWHQVPDHPRLRDTQANRRWVAVQLPRGARSMTKMLEDCCTDAPYLAGLRAEVSRLFGIRRGLIGRIHGYWKTNKYWKTMMIARYSHGGHSAEGPGIAS
jgi:hypothetical protein